MNTTHKHAARFYRNHDTPAARLARWQNTPSPRRLAQIRAARYHGDSIAARRASLIQHQGPELSSPEAEAALLWLDPDDTRAAYTLTPADGSRAYPLDHLGWYAIDDCIDAVIASAAVILGDFPNIVFPAIYSTQGEPTLRVMLDEGEPIDFTHDDTDPDSVRMDAMRETVRAYDSQAEREAEEERDYQARESLRCELEENRQERADTRAELRDLIQEARDHCADLPPGIAKATRYAIGYARHKLNKLAIRNREILDQI